MLNGGEHNVGYQGGRPARSAVDRSCLVRIQASHFRIRKSADEVVMTVRPLLVSLLVMVMVGGGARGQNAAAEPPVAAAGDLNPLLCLEAGGPTAAVTA